MAHYQFDATNIDPTNNFAPIPAGVYVAQVVDSEVKYTKSGSGQYIALQFEVLQGDQAGRKVFSNINIHNPSQQAEEIGQKQLSQLCHATGVIKFTDTAQLHMKPVKIKVKIRKDTTGQYDDRNEISAFESVGGQTSKVAPAQPQPAPAAAPWAGAR